MLSLSRRRFTAAATAFASVGLVHAPAKAAQFEFKLGTVLEPDRPAVIRLKEMWDTINKESGGRVLTQIFPSNQLGNESAMFTQLRVGAMPFMLISPGFLASVIPLADISNIGFVFKDESDALRILDSPLGAYVRNEIISKGVYAFRQVWTAGMYAVGCAPRPIVVPDDLKGIKIRVAGKIAVDLFKELGANPSTITLAEVYTGLQTKLIDAEAAPLTVIETTHFYEVQKYISLTNHAWSSEWMIANADTWKGIPADLQAIIERNHAKYNALARKDQIASNAGVVAKLRGHGATVNNVDQTPFRTHLATYYQTWAQTFGPQAWSLLETAAGHKIG